MKQAKRKHCRHPVLNMEYIRFEDRGHNFKTTLLTNFSEKMRPAYVATVKRFRNKNFVVATRSAGRWPEYGGSLHYLGRGDCGPFWRVFDDVKAELGLSEI